MIDTTPNMLDFSQSKINKDLTNEQKIQFFRDMARIRRFEQVALKFYNKGMMGGFLHLYIGQESVATGTIGLCGENDHIITAYRCHGHALSVGMDMNSCMAELYGKATGSASGKGGSMHLFDPSKNFWGGHGIVAGQTPLGLGLAYGVKYQNLEGCCLCYLGDGATNQGVFHECLNIAALFQLPVVYIIENNGYSMGTSQDRSSSYKHCLAQRAEAYDMDWDLVNGEDLYEVRAKTHIAIERARKEVKPTLLEIATYRYYGHSVADANAKKYRRPTRLPSLQSSRPHPQPNQSSTTSTGKPTTTPRHPKPDATSSTTKPPPPGHSQHLTEHFPNERTPLPPRHPRSTR